MTKFLEYLHEAQKIVSVIDHIYYVSYPLVQDKRMLIKILVEAKKAIASCINAILQYEYLFTRIVLYKDPNLNMRNFEIKCASLYEISDSEIKKIRELFEIVKQHQQSPFEFKKNGKIIILSEDMHPTILTEDKIKEFLILSKNVLQKTKNRMKN